VYQFEITPISTDGIGEDVSVCSIKDSGGFCLKISRAAWRQAFHTDSRRDAGSAIISSLNRRASGTDTGTRHRLQHAEQPSPHGMLPPSLLIRRNTISVILSQSARAGGTISASFARSLQRPIWKAKVSPRISSSRPITFFMLLEFLLAPLLLSPVIVVKHSATRLLSIPRLTFTK
jgi:hypothetical protein